MKTKQYQLNIGELTIPVTKKRMRNMRISISPPFGEIKISAPLRVSLKEISKFAENKIDWAIYNQKLIQNKYKE